MGQQIVGDMVFAMVAAEMVQIKLCADSERVESVIDMGYILHLKTYEDFDHDNLCICLSSKAATFKKMATIDMIWQNSPQNLEN